jgi:hypothetical protein
MIPAAPLVARHPRAEDPLGSQGKSRMRERARMDLCGGRSAMVVPTAVESYRAQSASACEAGASPQPTVAWPSIRLQRECSAAFDQLSRL